jgi:hypothetical protein
VEARPISDSNRRLYRKIEEQDQPAGLSAFSSRTADVPAACATLAATACLVLVAGFMIDNPGRMVTPAIEARKFAKWSR